MQIVFLFCRFHRGQWKTKIGRRPGKDNSKAQLDSEVKKMVVVCARVKRRERMISNIVENNKQNDRRQREIKMR